jgi:hypothetical protein
MEVNVKMEGFIFSGLFWGIVVILIGISIVITAIFPGIKIPIIQVLIAFFFIYIGIKILTGGFKAPAGKVDQNNVIFNEGTMHYGGDNPAKEFNVVFGKGTTRLADAQLNDGANPVKITVVFGEGIVEIDPSVPMIIHTSASFASSIMPDKTINSFGSYTYQSPSYSKDKKHLDIQANVVFGELRFEEVNRKKK